MAAPEPTTGFSRRKLLKGSALGFLLVTLGGTGLALAPSKRRTRPREGLRVLTDDEYAILSAIAARVCPEAGPGVPGADAIDVALQADRMFVRAEDDARAGVKTALGIFESGLVGALFGERVKPFTQLDPDAQDRVLTAWHTSDVAARRTIHRALVSLASSIYYGDPRVWPSIGYDGPPNPAALRVAYAENLVDMRALRAPSERR